MKSTFETGSVSSIHVATLTKSMKRFPCNSFSDACFITCNVYLSSQYVS